MVLVLAALLAAAAAGAALLAARLRRISAERDGLLDRFRGVVDVEAERTRVLAALDAERRRTLDGLAASKRETEAAAAALTREADDRRRVAEEGVRQLRQEIASLDVRRSQLQTEVSLLDEQAHLFSFGLYAPRYAFSDSAEYALRLERVRDEQKRMVKEKSAAVGDVAWEVNGSAAEGRKQINQTLKLMLRAFNGECDAAVAKVRYNNVHVMEARIQKTWETINSLAEVQRCRITKSYLVAKLDELHLAHEYEEKLQAEKEEQRRIREQMREEEIARREIEKAQQEAEREEDRYQQALEKAQRDVAAAVGAKQQKLQAQIAELERKLTEAHERKERAISRAQLTRSGHVYVISNVGSFGEHVYKIGMTRRLDPLDRIKELGDASVPFEFDVHAVIYSEDAPALEASLHRAFTRHRVNRVNERKEFFRVSIEAIAEAVRAERGEIEVTLAAEAAEWRKTVAMVEEERSRSIARSLYSPEPSALEHLGQSVALSA